jgi:hypothetical protein
MSEAIVDIALVVLIISLRMTTEKSHEGHSGRAGSDFSHLHDLEMVLFSCPHEVSGTANSHPCLATLFGNLTMSISR